MKWLLCLSIRPVTAFAPAIQREMKTKEDRRGGWVEELWKGERMAEEREKKRGPDTGERPEYWRSDREEESHAEDRWREEVWSSEGPRGGQGEEERRG